MGAGDVSSHKCQNRNDYTPSSGIKWINSHFYHTSDLLSTQTDIASQHAFGNSMALTSHVGRPLHMSSLRHPNIFGSPSLTADKSIVSAAIRTSVTVCDQGWHDPGRCTGCWWLLWRWCSQMGAKPCAGFSWWSPGYQRPRLHGDAYHQCTLAGSAAQPEACCFPSMPPGLRLAPSPCQTSGRSCCMPLSWWRWERRRDGHNEICRWGREEKRGSGKRGKQKQKAKDWLDVCKACLQDWFKCRVMAEAEHSGNHCWQKHTDTLPLLCFLQGLKHTVCPSSSPFNLDHSPVWAVPNTLELVEDAVVFIEGAQLTP